MSDNNTVPPGFVNPLPAHSTRTEDRPATVTPLSTRAVPESPRATDSDTMSQDTTQLDEMNEAATRTTGGETEESVGKIRDILFGGHMREYEIRFQNLEAHLQSESRRAQDEIERRFGRLEDYIREEFTKLSSRLQHETSERTEATKTLETTISTAEGRMSSIMQTLDTGLKKDYQDLRRNLYDLGLEQEQKLRDARGELIASMQTHSRQLQNDKLGRDTLATLLDDLAARVRTDKNSD